MKKKIIITSIFISLVSIVAFNSLAYFTSKETTVNIITTGSVKVKIIETGYDGLAFPKEGVKRIVPGSEVVKNVVVQNDGNNPMWLRVKAVKRFINNDELDTEVADMDFNLDYWELKDGWYYYNDVVLPQAVSESLFTQVVFDADNMNNEYQDSEFTLEVIAEGVQSENNGTDALTSFGWED